MKQTIVSLFQIVVFLLFFIFCTGILLLCMNCIPGNGTLQEVNALKNQTNSPFESSLTRGRWALIQAIVDEGTISIDIYATTTFPDIIYHNGHYYSVFVPGAVFFALPFYTIAEQYNLAVLAVNLLGPISVLLTGLVVYCTLRLLRITNPVSLLTVFLMIFGTQLFSYSTIFNAHYLSALAIALALAGTVLVIKENQQGIGYPIFWLAFGMGLVVDYPNAITLVPLALLLFYNAFYRSKNKKGQQIIRINSLFFLSFFIVLLFLIPLALYTKSIFGTFLTTIENHQINGYLDHGKINYHLAPDPEFYLDKHIVYKTLNLSVQYLPMGIFTTLVSLPRGLFMYSPILLLTLPGILFFGKTNRHLMYASGASIITTILVYSSYADYAGGWAYGPRFFIGMLPVFAVFLAHAIQGYFRLANKQLKVGIAFLPVVLYTGIASITIATVGALTSKLLVSPIENNNWGVSDSFLANISQIGSEHFVSFVYDRYLQQTMSHEQFFFLITGGLIGVFILLIVFTMITTKE